MASDHLGRFLYSVKKWGSRGAKISFLEVAAIFGAINGPFLPLLDPLGQKFRQFFAFRTLPKLIEVKSEIDFWTTNEIQKFLGQLFPQIKMPVATLVYDIAKGL